MESLSVAFSSPPTLQSHPTDRKTAFSEPICILPGSFSTSQSFRYHLAHLPFAEAYPQNHRFSLNLHDSNIFKSLEKSPVCFTVLNLFSSLPCFASEAVGLSTEQVPEKINLETLLVSIDDFFNRNPFFVAGCTFIWLVVIPLTQRYLRKYKDISCIDAFRKLRDDPNAQLLDIRDRGSVAFLRSPNLTILKKSAVQVPFVEGDEDGFVKKVLVDFPDPKNTVICVLDNFDGNSMKVAELLFKNGFKEAYAIKGGVRGKKGWQEIQETLLPSSVHIYSKKKKEAKISQNLEMRGGIRQNKETSDTSSSANFTTGGSRRINNVRKSVESAEQIKPASRSSSPYPNYPDLKPPSSPMPSKPRT